jgi:predicted phage terminase large subunit-like protein
MTKDEINNIKLLKVAKVMCLQSFFFFTRYFFKARFNKKFVVGEHHKIVSEALEKVYKGEIKRLMINIAPRYSKTELAVINFIANGLALNPAAKFIHLSYSDSLALNNSEAAKDLVQSHEYQQLFPEVQIKKDSKAKKKWYTTAGGGVYATSSSGQVTGFGAGGVDNEDEEIEFGELLTNLEEKEGFAGAIIIDDPLKPEDAYSDIKREKVNFRYDSTISNRVNSRNTPIIIMMQRLHPQDLCGYLMEKEGVVENGGVWTVLSLPAIKSDGTALWPLKHTIEELKLMWQKMAIVFQSQYLQNPKPKEGLMYKTLRFYQALPVGIYSIKCVIDTADTGEDYLCAIIYLSTPTGYYILDVYYTQDGMETTENETAIFLTKYKVESCKVESNNGGRGFCRNVEKNCRTLNNWITSFKWYHQKDNKEVRIFNKAAEVQNMIYFPEHLKTSLFYSHISNFLAKGKNNHDDGPDALTMIIENENTTKQKSYAV